MVFRAYTELICVFERMREGNRKLSKIAAEDLSDLSEDL